MKTPREFPATFPSLFDYSEAASSVPAQAARALHSVRGADAGFSVSSADTVLVTAVRGSRLVATVEITGAADTAALMSMAAAALAGVGGLVTLRMRNRDRGTVARRVVMLGRHTMPRLR